MSSWSLFWEVRCICVVDNNIVEVLLQFGIGYGYHVFMLRADRSRAVLEVRIVSTILDWDYSHVVCLDRHSEDFIEAALDHGIAVLETTTISAHVPIRGQTADPCFEAMHNLTTSSVLVSRRDAR